jgi:hypothetical protein
MPKWTVYTKAECSLCETMLGALAELVGAAAEVAVIDIDGDAQLERKYGQRVPVLMADGEFVCAYRLDEQRVRALIRL